MSTKEQFNRIREEKCNKILKDRIKLSKMMNKIAKERAILHCELEVSKKNLVVGHLKKSRLLPDASKCYFALTIWH